MENRKRPSSYSKRDNNKSGGRTYKKDDKPFKRDGKSREGKESFDKPARFKKDGESDRKPYKKEGGFKRDFKKFDREDKPRFKKDNTDKPQQLDLFGESKPAKREFKKFDREDKPARFKRDGDTDRKPFKREGGFKKDFKKFDREDKPRFKREGDNDRKPFKREGGFKKDFKKFDGEDKPRFKKEGDEDRKPFKKDFKKFDNDKRDFKKPGFKKEEEPTNGRPIDRKTGQPLKYHKYNNSAKEEKELKAPDKQMTLNKYIAYSGECSRREAAEMVKQGKVKVNGELVLDPGYRVLPNDNVTFAGKKLTPTKHFVYVLLNKPKDYITTTDDPEGRKTVMELVEGVEVERLFPVGRLDRNTSGLLVLTNDGDLAQKLSHPSYETKKVYQATLDRPLEMEDFEKIKKGVELEDGRAKVDAISYLDKKNEIGLEIHSGKNRIVRRIFESLQYDVEKLDRVMYAGLTKKNLPRGKWRLLSEKEIVFLKHFKAK